MTDLERKAIVEAITRMLARREHSAKEIRYKLSQKDVNHTLIEAILQEFIDAGIQSDARYAEMKVRNGASKGQGLMRIRQELAQQGMSSADISTAIDEAEIDWFDLALKVKVKKFGLSSHKDDKEKFKRMQFLRYRGFERDEIEHALYGQSD